MSALTQEFADLALEMLSEDGVPVVVTTPEYGAMTASGDRLGVAPAPRNAMGLIFPGRGTIAVNGQDRASERIIMTPVQPWPSPGELISIAGRQLTVGDDGVKTYAPDGLPIFHDLAVAS